MWGWAGGALAAYHGEIGREATAATDDASVMSSAYHGEIGREATATGLS